MISGVNSAPLAACRTTSSVRPASRRISPGGKCCKRKSSLSRCDAESRCAAPLGAAGSGSSWGAEIVTWRNPFCGVAGADCSASHAATRPRIWAPGTAELMIFLSVDGARPRASAIAALADASLLRTSVCNRCRRSSQSLTAADDAPLSFWAGRGGAATIRGVASR